MDQLAFSQIVLVGNDETYISENIFKCGNCENTGVEMEYQQLSLLVLKLPCFPFLCFSPWYLNNPNVYLIFHYMFPLLIYKYPYISLFLSVCLCLNVCMRVYLCVGVFMSSCRWLCAYMCVCLTKYVVTSTKT